MDTIYTKNMESRSHHSRLANMVNTPRLTQKSFNHHTQFNGIRNNGFQAVQNPNAHMINSVNIQTKFK